MINSNIQQAVQTLQKTSQIFLPARIQIWFRDRLYKIVQQETEEAFDKEGIPKWEKLSSTYKKWKDINYPGKKILVKTGKLSNWIHGASSPYGNYNANGLSFYFPKLENGALRETSYMYHQDGTSKMPQRQIVKFFPGEENRIITSLYDWFKENLILTGWR